MLYFPPMIRLQHAIAALLVAGSTLVAATPASAQEADQAAATSPVYSLFTSWFGGPKAKVDAPAVATDATADFDEAEMPPAVGHPVLGVKAGALIADALALIGISYRMGGTSPTSGFDCSGMVRYVFQNAVGLSLPRRAEEISRVGVKVARDQLKPGDLVFYKTLRKTFSHVGIYLGNNRFIHAPSAGGAVRIDDMNQSYWSARFNGARRVDG